MHSTVSIFSIIDYPRLGEAIIISVILLHLALVALSILVIAISAWSIFNHPVWTWKSYAAVISSIFYLVVTWVIFQ